jgi:hypothetical protein
LIAFGNIFFCEKVILNRDGSPREFINRFKTVHTDSYPFLFGFSIVADLFYDNALFKWLSIRIRGSNGKIIFEGARQHIESNTPPHPQSKITVISTLENVEFPKPDDCTLYILLDGAVMHQDLLSFAQR